MYSQPVIVIADDDPSDRFLIKTAIEEVGLNVQVVECENGAEMIDFAKVECAKRSPRMIILDINMPKYNGIEVLQFLESNPSLCSVPVFVFSTSTDPADAIKTLELGAKKYFVKPIDFSGYLAFAETVKQYMFH